MDDKNPTIVSQKGLETCSADLLNTQRITQEQIVMVLPQQTTCLVWKLQRKKFLCCGKWKIIKGQTQQNPFYK